MKKLLFIPFLLILFDLFGTVGGPKYLTYLGSRDSSLYFILESHDQFVSPPQLWRYDLRTDSLSSTTDWINYPKETIDEALIRNGLDSLGQELFRKVGADSLKVDYKAPVEQYMESMDVYYQSFPMEVRWKNTLVQLVQCYDTASLPFIVDQYQHNEIALSFTIVRYRGICFETGYEKDTILFSNFSEVEKRSDEIDTRTIEENEIPGNNHSKFLIIAIIALAVILMTIIILKRKK